MKIKKALFFLTLSILLGACASQKEVFRFKGSLSATNYKIEAPLVAYDNNRFILKVKIQGKDYNFMVSTGHHFGLIDKKLAQKLGYKIFQKDNMDLCIVPKLNNEKIIIASHVDSLQFAGNKQVVNFHTQYTK